MTLAVPEDLRLDILKLQNISNVQTLFYYYSIVLLLLLLFFFIVLLFYFQHMLKDFIVIKLLRSDLKCVQMQPSVTNVTKCND